MQLLLTKNIYVDKLVFQTCSQNSCEKMILKFLQDMCKIIWKIIIEGSYQLFTASLEGCMKSDSLTFVLGPVLFNIFVTDLAYEIWMMLIKFQVLKAGRGFKHGGSRIRVDLDAMEH